MTRLLQSGLETGDTTALGADTAGSSGGTVTIATATPTPRTGTYCLKCTWGTPNNSTTNATAWVGRKTVAHASKTELYLAFGFYSHPGAAVATPPGYCFCRLLDTSGNVNILVFVDSGTVRAYYATAGGANPSSAQITLIAAGSSSLSNDAWHLIEIHVVAATGATGTFELKLDGSSIISATSQRTCQTNANFGAFALEQNNQVNSASGVGAGAYHAFDDIRLQDTAGSVNNGWPGDEKIVALVPNAAGDSAQFSRGGADSGANYSQCDELPPNGTTDYVYDSTVGHLDLYNTTTTAIAAVSAVSVVAQAFNSDGGGGTVYFPTKTGAGQSDGSAQAISGSPSYYTRLLELDPADSAAWTQAKIDALQIGIKVAS